MKYLTVSADNHVVVISTRQTAGTVPYDGEMPTAEEGYHLEYRDGKVVAVSDRDASAERRAAYEVECDPLSMAYVGYMLEGNEEAAAGCKAAYLTKKAEIRTRIPD